MAIQYIDGVPCIDGGGEIRKLAALPPPPHMLATASRFSDYAAPDPSTWVNFDFAEVVDLVIRNQSSHGSCTGHAGVTAEDIILRKIGAKPPLLSCTFPYAQVNGGRDQGASVSSILQVLRQLGTCTQAECGTDQIYKNQIPTSAYETAKKYQVFEAFLCRTFEELCEAINRGFPVALGIQVGNNFSRLSSDGIAPLPDMVAGGHALCGIGIKKHNGGWIVKVQNSWGESWGVKGCCYLTRGHFTNMIDGYAIMYAENINPPPPAKVAYSIPRDIQVIMKVEDDKFVAAVNEQLPTSPEPEPQEELTTAVPELPAEPAEVKPITQESSLLAQFKEEDTDKPVEGSASMVHTDPDALLGSSGKHRKNRHKR